MSRLSDLLHPLVQVEKRKQNRFKVYKSETLALKIEQISGESDKPKEKPKANDR
ncbi:MAG: hypothetical protein RBT47_07015 [Anaerolineae bacterium]|jgi:hypothetical protein|nr:hypothetical protein [Anaerolineae bacterium]